ncbi:MAG: dockerin type I repeat-containing protein [Oscillospiraceae bacterium]|nr:dockerin type I repeat-containing protein [Oscillospiraceae bacterium]
MKQYTMRVLAMVMSAAISAVSFTIPSAALEDGEFSGFVAASEMPDAKELKEIGSFTVKNGVVMPYAIELPDQQRYSAYYFVIDQTSGYDKVTAHVGIGGVRPEAEKVISLYKMQLDSVNFEKYPEIPENERFAAYRLGALDNATQIRIACNKAEFTGDDDEDGSFRFTVYGWTPKVKVTSVYTGEYDAYGHQTQMEDPGTVPTYRLVFSDYPQITYTQGETFDVKALPVHLVATSDYHIKYYDIRDYLYTEQPVSLENVGTQKITMKTSYRTSDGGGDGLSLDLPIEVVAKAGETTPTMPSLPIMGVVTTTMPKIVTTAYEDPNYSPWFTNEEGYTYNRGTNAFNGYTLQIVTKSRTEFAVGEAFDPTGLKVFLVENRTHNSLYYDISDFINIKTDYNPDVQGKYTVEISTDFVGNEGGTKDVATYEVEVTERMTTGPDEGEQGSSISRETTETTATGVVTTAYEDPNYSPWFTDADGHTYNRGTNACLGYYLSIVTKGRTEFAVGEAFDPAGLVVHLVEDRTYNDCYYDVSDQLIIDTNYDPNVPGKYQVSVFTEYAGREGKASEPVTYEVEVSAKMTTGPDEGETGTVLSSSETTETLVSVGSTNVLGDANCDKQLTVSDAIMVARVVAEDKTVQITEQGLRNADMNQNGAPDQEDITKILTKLAGLW